MSARRSRRPRGPRGVPNSCSTGGPSRARALSPARARLARGTHAAQLRQSRESRRSLASITRIASLTCVNRADTVVRSEAPALTAKRLLTDPGVSVAGRAAGRVARPERTSGAGWAILAPCALDLWVCGAGVRDAAKSSSSQAVIAALGREIDGVLRRVRRGGHARAQSSVSDDCEREQELRYLRKHEHSSFARMVNIVSGAQAGCSVCADGESPTSPSPRPTPPCWFVKVTRGASTL
jgi:hypothetical protein